MENRSSPAEYVYGATLRVPGELTVSEDESTDPQQFVSEFRRHMHKVRAAPVKHNKSSKVFVYKELLECTHVFLRAPPNKKSLQRPYSGPHKILNRVSERVFQIDVNGKPKNVSVENVKPAHFIPYDEWITLNRASSGRSSGDRAILKVVPSIQSKWKGQPIFNVQNYATQTNPNINVENNRSSNIDDTNEFQRLSEQCTTPGTENPVAKL